MPNAPPCPTTANSAVLPEHRHDDLAGIERKIIRDDRRKDTNPVEDDAAARSPKVLLLPNVFKALLFRQQDHARVISYRCVTIGKGVNRPKNVAV